MLRRFSDAFLAHDRRPIQSRLGASQTLVPATQIVEFAHLGNIQFFRLAAARSQVVGDRLLSVGELHAHFLTVVAVADCFAVRSAAY